MTNPVKAATTGAISLAIALSLGACASVPPEQGDALGTATLVDTRGSPTGEARLVRVGDSVELSVTAQGLTPGEHGLHLHTTGRCTLPDFTSAGGHLNPTNQAHGLLGNDGSHLGDLPNLVAGANGSASTQVRIDAAPGYALDQIFDADGTAIVIHSGPDDGRTDPSGNSGSRVACGVMTRS